MFLHLLSEEEKISFLRLAVLTAVSDGNIAEEEKQFLRQYIHECGYQEYLYESDSRDLAAVLGALASGTVQVKKAIFIELAALVFSDKVYEDTEKDFLEQVAKSFQLDSLLVDLAIDWVKRMNELYREAAGLLG